MKSVSSWIWTRVTVSISYDEIELLISRKMDLALNNLQGLICHKIKLTNQTKLVPLTNFDGSFRVQPITIDMTVNLMFYNFF